MKYLIFLISLLTIACQKQTDTMFQTGIESVNADLVWKEKISDEPNFLYSKKVLSNDGGAIYIRKFAGPEKTVVCRDLETGALRFEWEAADDVPDGEFISYLGAKDNKIIVGSWNDVNVIDSRNGAPIWRTDARPTGWYGGNRTSMIDDELYHEWSKDNEHQIRLTRTQIATGKLDTMVSFGPSDYADTRFLIYNCAKWRDPVSMRNLLIFERSRSKSGQKSKVDLVALNMDTKLVEWTIEDFEPNGYIAAQAPILIHGNKAFILGAITLFCVDLTKHKIIWTKSYNERTPDFFSEHLQYTTPRIVGDLLIIKPLSERCFAYNVNTDTEVWRNSEGAYDAIDVEEYKGYLFMPSYQQGDIWVHRVSDGKLITRLKTPHANTYIFEDIAIDRDKGLLFCTDDYYAMCFKLNVK
jgi:outer membrane protein assembly factor BamB